MRARGLSRRSSEINMLFPQRINLDFISVQCDLDIYKMSDLHVRSQEGVLKELSNSTAMWKAKDFLFYGNTPFLPMTVM